MATNCDGFTIPADHPDAARDYTTATAVVSDKATGLMWERTPTSSTLGRFSEQMCTTKTTGGFDGWRRPTLLELISLTDYAVQNPALDVAAFPDPRAGDFAASTSVYVQGSPVGGMDYGWSVRSATGLLVNGLAPTFLFRCVRELTPRRCYPTAERYQPTAVSSVQEARDVFSGLTWQRQSTGNKTFSEAKSYCEGLGNGYRLPGVKELLSIVDFKATEPPAIDGKAFPGTPSAALFWSATKVAGEASKVLAVQYKSADHANAQAVADNEGQYVRCVR